MTLVGMVLATLARLSAVLPLWHWPREVVKLSCASSMMSASMALQLGAVVDVAVCSPGHGCE